MVSLRIRSTLNLSKICHFGTRSKTFCTLDILARIHTHAILIILIDIETQKRVLIVRTLYAREDRLKRTRSLAHFAVWCCVLLVLVESCSRTKETVGAENLLVTRNAIKKVCVFRRACSSRWRIDGVGHTGTLARISSSPRRFSRHLTIAVFICMPTIKTGPKDRRVYEYSFPIDDP